ncbi:hypothetical protein COLO4_25249 [Corchorus olitorius]|uniref:RNase H type-1 domain-containing protein n=1 Tax=Corchorus olitorius TaxID=93759 RepID=A0A1R3I3T4_9ROSI|nr:hypothetical protein COLO4_25249 [Corchorus olitorius]
MENTNSAEAIATLTDGDDSQELKSVIGFQRQQLMEAKTLYSDFDLAFKLQMQEAASASLSLHPPSTSQDAAVLPPSEMDFDYSAVMLEDLDRFEVERTDMGKAEEEMRRLRDDLNRSIHDQHFASYILNVPEEEWKNYGDKYERPYTDNVATRVVSTESFRIYVKGLVSEERVWDTKVRVGGVGVAICDFRDNLVLEVRKKLEGAEFMSHEMAGLEAVVHGLNAALSLDLKRVTVLVDDFLVHQYVTGILEAGQSKMGAIVNEVVRLRKKFSFFHASLLMTHNELKFAFKLARDAIVSQISWPAESSNGGGLKETCVIFFEEIDAAKMFSVAGCFHRCGYEFCYTCGAEWRNKKATCSCPIWDERNIIHNQPRRQ